MATIIAPIWEDTYYTTTSSPTVYRLTLDGRTVFSGKAIKYPGAETLEINVNRLCQNYLESDIASLLEQMPSTPSSISHPNTQRTFNFYVDDTLINQYVFYQDYSYTHDKPTTGTSIDISNPINGHYVPGMLKLKTKRRSTTDSTNVVITAGGTEDDESLGYTTQVKCAPYVLYYLNSYGGWDAFVIEGTVLKKDNFTTFKTDRAFNNTTLQFETNKYVQEVRTTYEMNTGLLNDEQAANLSKNLLGSLKVYLQNIDEGWVKPVIITDGAATYQTYQTNGRKLSQYKITVQESQSKVRR